MQSPVVDLQSVARKVRLGETRPLSVAGNEATWPGEEGAMAADLVDVLAGIPAADLERELNAAREVLLAAGDVPAELRGFTLDQVHGMAATEVRVETRTSSFLPSHDVYEAVVVLGPPALAAIKAYFDYLSAKVRARRGERAVRAK
jgi:hypothetical protein